MSDRKPRCDGLLETPQCRSLLVDAFDPWTANMLACLEENRELYDKLANMSDEEMEEISRLTHLG